MSETRVEALYGALKRMAVDFRIRPGERINEVALARELDASRTPLREALNRLVAEQLIEFQPGKGFFCRKLEPDSIFELYELREIVEVAAVRRACVRASEEEIAALKGDLHANGLSHIGKTVREVTVFDEAFHLGIARLSGNGELVRELENINERIRYIRWIDMASRVATTKGEHRKIMDAIEKRDGELAASVMRQHISKRMDQVTASVREGYSNIYMPGGDELFDRPLAVGEN
ncbi:MAG: GntR family transcriptional regulator [Nitratireductor sp.]